MRTTRKLRGRTHAGDPKNEKLTVGITKRDILAMSGLDKGIYEQLRRFGYLPKDGRKWSRHDRIDAAMFYLVATLRELAASWRDDVRIAKFAAYPLYEFCQGAGGEKRYLVVQRDTYRCCSTIDVTGPAPAIVIDLAAAGAALAARIRAVSETLALEKH